MFSKIAIIFVILFQVINGHPLESAQPQYDFKNLLTSRIVGGQDAPEGYGKYMVALVAGYYMKTLVCGGSIISGQYVLSAAHCIEPFVYWGELLSSFKGVIGSHYWNSSQYIKFSHFDIHPNWDWATLKNDIGVVKTTEKMVFSNRVGYIALNRRWIPGGEQGFVTGWGRVEAWGDIPCHLQMLHATTISGKQCIAAWKNVSLIVGTTPPVHPDVEICTLHSAGQGMCNGDSGSPLVMSDLRQSDSGSPLGTLKLQQVGIVSWGLACAHGVPDVYTRISAYTHYLAKYL
ncbi:chymotrypsin-2-like [Nymphalis io]|uniref:chymotrypsin-2-like n=1 Tax=Inachis io TaxID=171585 RepID=UPI002168F8F9|nr:chymotrypsin-2-like [Nymphalis io]